MAMTDPLGDMLTRIRNGQQAKKDSVLTPASTLRVRVLDVLQREGYIRGYSEEALGAKGQHKGIRIELKYFEGQPAIRHVARVSKPGRRVYSRSEEHTSELQSLMRISYAVFCLKKKTTHTTLQNTHHYTTNTKNEEHENATLK